MAIVFRVIAWALIVKLGKTIYFWGLLLVLLGSAKDRSRGLEAKV